MDVREKLHEFYLFEEDVLRNVERTAAEQNGRSVADIAAEYGVGITLHRPRPSMEQIRRLEYLDLVPPVDRYPSYDESHARILFTPIDTPIGQSVARQALRLYGAQPDQRLMVVGGPSSPLDNTVRFSDAPKVWRGQLQAVVDPTLMLLSNRHIESIDVLGMFTGAELAAATAAAVAAKKRDLRVRQVTRGVFVLPAAVRPQSPADAWRKIVAPGDETSPLRAAARRARLTNIVMASAVARGGFYDRISRALDEHDELHTTIIWSTASEAADQEATVSVINKLRARFLVPRVGAVAIEQADRSVIQSDDDLHTAVMLQGLATSAA